MAVVNSCLAYNNLPAKWGLQRSDLRVVQEVPGSWRATASSGFKPSEDPADWPLAATGTNMSVRGPFRGARQQFQFVPASLLKLFAPSLDKLSFRNTIAVTVTVKDPLVHGNKVLLNAPS